MQVNSNKLVAGAVLCAVVWAAYQLALSVAICEREWSMKDVRIQQSTIGTYRYILPDGRNMGGSFKTIEGAKDAAQFMVRIHNETVQEHHASWLTVTNQ